MPEWLSRLPDLNAGLNSLSTVMLLCGFVAIKRGRKELHKRTMLAAFAVSSLFLLSYLTYHFALKHYTGAGSKSFGGIGVIRTAYLSILISHSVLAAIVPFLTIITIRRGLRQDWTAHRKIARITFPIWIYVSVTGVIIYFMLYHL